MQHQDGPVRSTNVNQNSADINQTLTQPIYTSRSQRIAQQSSGNKQNKNKKQVYILAAIVIISVVYALYDFMGKQETHTVASNSQPTPTEFITDTSFQEPTPTDIKEDIDDDEEVSPTKKPEATPTLRPKTDPIDKSTGLDRSDLSITILNGSGIAGAAAKMRTLLESYGYTVESIGNADNQDYEKTVIETNESTKKYIDLLERDLSDDYTIGSTSAELFSTGARIIIGKE